MIKRELIDYCISMPESFEDYPFDNHTAVIKHSENKKMFALIDIMDNKLYINLKCEPMRADFLRNVYKSVIPGYHMNKEHWNTIFIEGDVPIDELHSMIQESYDLIKPKRGKK